jgi:hypothetical protein
MKRVLLPALVVLSVLSLLPNSTSSARRLDEKQPPSAWVDLGNGIQLLRVWQLGKPNVWPQVAIMEMPNAVYLKYFQDPHGFMAFVNQNKVFSKDIIKPGPWVTLSSYDDKGASPDWIVTLMHGKLSYMLVSALPKLMQDTPYQTVK